MNKKIFIPLLCCCLMMNAIAQKSVEIIYGDNAKHIGKITADSIVVVSGSTYSFTVDLPVFSNDTLVSD